MLAAKDVKEKFRCKVPSITVIGKADYGDSDAGRSITVIDKADAGDGYRMIHTDLRQSGASRELRRVSLSRRNGTLGVRQA